MLDILGQLAEAVRSCECAPDVCEDCALHAAAALEIERLRAIKEPAA